MEEHGKAMEMIQKHWTSMYWHIIDTHRRSLQSLEKHTNKIGGRRIPKEGARSEQVGGEKAGQRGLIGRCFHHFPMLFITFQNLFNACSIPFSTLCFCVECSFMLVLCLFSLFSISFIAFLCFSSVSDAFPILFRCFPMCSRIFVHAFQFFFHTCSLRFQCCSMLFDGLLFLHACSILAQCLCNAFLLF